MVKLNTRRDLYGVRHFVAKYPRIIPLFILVVVPILIFFSQEMQIYSPLPVSNFSYEIYENIRNFRDIKPTVVTYFPFNLVSDQGTGIRRTPTTGLWVVTYFYNINGSALPFLTISLLYAFYPLKHHPDEYFKRKGLSQAITEYGLVKKILYIEIPLLLLFTSISYVASIVESGYANIESYVAIHLAQVALEYSITAGTFWILLQMARKEFRYYLAKAYIKSIPDNCDDIQKLNWLTKALHSYNKYLLRNLKLQIDNLKVYSRLVVESDAQVSDRIKVLSESFDNSDKLMPARRLSEIMEIDKKEEFLTKQTISARIITWGTLAGAILPVVISIIQSLFQSKTPVINH
jgi:hypothetical protein